MIPAPSCLLACLDNVRRYNLNESRAEILFRKNYCQRTDSDLVGRELRVTNIRWVRIIFIFFIQQDDIFPLSLILFDTKMILVIIDVLFNEVTKDQRKNMIRGWSVSY